MFVAGYRIPNQPTRKHFMDLVNVIWERNVNSDVIDDIVEFCKSKNPRFNEDLFYQAIEEHPMNDMDESNHP
tara:strand:- start:253 stop:468 length:216 start_codon:yes stop_codon:yes gene_type:complete